MVKITVKSITVLVGDVSEINRIFIDKRFAELMRLLWVNNIKLSVHLLSWNKHIQSRSNIDRFHHLNDLVVAMGHLYSQAIAKKKDGN